MPIVFDWMGDDLPDEAALRAPVHLGKPELIGIKDIEKPTWGDPPEVQDDEVPVFWACGVTPQSVVATMKPEFCITHYPGCMLVTDRKNSEFAIM